MPNHIIFNERPECQDRMIELFKRMGYQYISRAEAEEKRGKLTMVLFEDELTRFLQKQTYRANGQEYHFSNESITKAIRNINVPILGGLLPASQEIYNLLTLGTSVTEKVPVKGELRNQDVDLNYVDFKNIDNNIFQITEEFSVEKLNGEHRRPDIIIMINGIPIAVIECKKSAIDVSVGIKQNCSNMMPDAIPELFKFAQLVLAVNPNKAKYGTCGTDEKWFCEWKEKPRSDEYNEKLNFFEAKSGSVQDEITVSLFERGRLLNIIKNYILYDAGIKKVARYQQFFAIENTMKRLKGEDKSETTDGGVIWHTQGSGKSLTMVMLVKRIMAEFAQDAPRFVMVCDRIDLDKQLTENFAATGLEPQRANTGSQLTALLDGTNPIITTIINKFETAVKTPTKKLGDNIYVLIDEAHRSHYGLLFNKMKEALRNAKMIAFTGTPLIAEENKQTVKQFGKLIHTYTMRDGIDDGIIVPLVYGSRIVRQDISNDEMLDEYFNTEANGITKEEKEDLKKKYSSYSVLAGLNSRISLIAFDINRDFNLTCVPKGLKAMVVCSSRAAAVDMYNCLKKFNGIRPIVSISFSGEGEGEDDDTTSDAIKKIGAYHNEVVKKKFGNNDEKYYEHILNSFAGASEDSYNILIVKDKHLTGFDAPIVGTLYIDKKIKEHNVLQAIARANRIYKTKDVGIIVDYIGVLKKLKEALDLYDAEDANLYGKENFEDAILSIQDAKLNLEKSYKELLLMFALVAERVKINRLTGNATNDAYQESLRNIEVREEFNSKLRDFEKQFYLAQSNRQLFVVVGLKQIEEYKKEWLFYKKLQASVKQRFEIDEIDDSEKVIIREDVMLGLLNQFVNASEVKEILKPFDIRNEAAMKNALKQIGVSKRAQADLIKTKVESKLKQVRYNDPLLYEEFSAKIKKTLADYENSRNEDAYLADIERIADDFRQGLDRQSYPIIIQDNSEAKAIYGSIVNEIKRKGLNISINQEEIIAKAAIAIKSILISKTKKDWKHNEIVQKEIKRELDDCLFDLFDGLGVAIDKTNIDVIDLIIDEVLKIAIMRF